MKITKDLKHFKRSEFTNPDRINTDLLWQLDHAREISHLPFIITSDYRAGDTRFHGEGKAVDISCKNSVERFTMVNALLAVGFNRIGIYQRHLHIDVGAPTGILWLGTYDQEEK